MEVTVEAERKVSTSDDWDYMLLFLPEGWEQSAADTGAMLRCRGFANAGTLLRALLIHLLDGCSLRETATRLRELGYADVSDVALLKRLNASGEWFRYMAKGLMEKTIPNQAWQVLPKGYGIRLVDATCISKPGSEGTDWRIHYCIDLPSLSCVDLALTDSSVGETFKNFTVDKKHLYIGDRGYSNRPGVAYIVDKGGDVLVRMNMDNLPLRMPGTENEFNLLRHLRTLSGRKIGEWAVEINHEGAIIPGRICAIKKSQEAALLAQKKILEAASKKQKIPKPETLEGAKYVFVFTTLPAEVLSAENALEVYRGRWQIELAFKRLKSLLEIGSLPKQDPGGSKSWIYGKMFAALLIEALISSAERFFPWGYPLTAPSEA